MALLLLYAPQTTEDEWERDGQAIRLGDDTQRTGREKAAANGSAWVDREPELRRYEVVD